MFEFWFYGQEEIFTIGKFSSQVIAMLKKLILDPRVGDSYGLKLCLDKLQQVFHIIAEKVNVPKCAFQNFVRKANISKYCKKVIYRPTTSLTGYQRVKQFQPDIGHHVHFLLKMIPASSMQYWFSISE